MLESAPGYKGAKDPRFVGPEMGSAPHPSTLGAEAAVWVLLAGILEPERSSGAVSQPAISEMEAHKLVYRLWVGGRDVVGSSSPTPGAGVAFVSAPWCSGNRGCWVFTGGWWPLGNPARARTFRSVGSEVGPPACPLGGRVSKAGAGTLGASGGGGRGGVQRAAEERRAEGQA